MSAQPKSSSGNGQDVSEQPQQRALAFMGGSALVTETGSIEFVFKDEDLDYSENGYRTLTVPASERVKLARFLDPVAPELTEVVKSFKAGAWGTDPTDPSVLARFMLRPTNERCVEQIAALVRAAENVADSETDEPNFEPFMADLQKAVEPLRRLISLPQVGRTVHYFNPSYAPADNEHTGVGPYAAIVTKRWEYGNSVMCNLVVITPGKDALVHIRGVPEQGSDMDDGKYPSWMRHTVQA